MEHKVTAEPATVEAPDVRVGSGIDLDAANTLRRRATELAAALHAAQAASEASTVADPAAAEAPAGVVDSAPDVPPGHGADTRKRFRQAFITLTLIAVAVYALLFGFLWLHSH